MKTIIKFFFAIALTFSLSNIEYVVNADSKSTIEYRDENGNLVEREFTPSNPNALARKGVQAFNHSVDDEQSESVVVVNAQVTQLNQHPFFYAVVALGVIMTIIYFLLSRKK